MKKYALWVSCIAVLLTLSAGQAFSVNKETIQMMTQLDSLQQQVQTLQRTVDTQTAVLKTLMQQTSQSVEAMKDVITKMQQAQQHSLATTSNQMDSMTSQIQQLSASLDETKGQLSRLSDQLAQTQKIIQTLNAPQPQQPAPGAGQPGQPGQPGQSGQADGSGNGPAAALRTVPDPQALYNSAYQDYTQGQYQLAVQGFQQYLQNYGNTALASNAQFYIGDAYYAQKDYKSAITQYDKCITQYPGGNKVAAATLKKGYALLALGQKTSGERELRSLIRRYPSSHEADLARERLRRSSHTTARVRRNG
ncbi:MAG TPA: tol-pal system protein YbgF [Terriglobia bacterium]|nr:tol-pal system protein YbgF [Terriglobia bacterium]